tara:strand:+ start:74949 stop:75407 length:459 start_codon:yes stop_codon:yes gene_type:complete
MENITTLEEARAYKFGVWAGNQNGQAYNEGKCVDTVWKKFSSYQCVNKNGYGPEKLYCKKHAPVDKNTPTTIWYEVSTRFNYNIVEIKVISETEMQLIDNNGYRLKKRDLHNIRFPSLKLAQDYLISIAKNNITDAEEQISKASEFINSVKS